MTDDQKGFLISIFHYFFICISFQNCQESLQKLGTFFENEMVLKIIGIKNDETKIFGLTYTKTFRRKTPSIDFINFWYIMKNDFENLVA